jgi:prephenate dehydrogenase
MKPFETVAIVGVGLIGGSIGLALRKRNMAEKVVGIGRRQVSLRVARKVGAVTNTTIDLAGGVVKADLVIVSSPVGQIIDHVRKIAEHCPEGTLITDTGSAKQAIVEALDSGLPRGCRFLGSHPLAGSEKSGAVNAQEDLFEGVMTVITPTKNTRAEDFDLLEQFWSDLGSMVVQMPADQHDQAMAVTSHLPHMAATALANTLPEKYFRLSATGMRDTSRLASGDPELWVHILTLNRGNVLTALEQYGSKLAALHTAIRDNDEDKLRQFLTSAKKNRDALGS